jgi:hypothetical protein
MNIFKKADPKIANPKVYLGPIVPAVSVAGNYNGVTSM